MKRIASIALWFLFLRTYAGSATPGIVAHQTIFYHVADGRVVSEAAFVVDVQSIVRKCSLGEPAWLSERNGKCFLGVTNFRHHGQEVSQSEIPLRSAGRSLIDSSFIAFCDKPQTAIYLFSQKRQTRIFSPEIGKSIIAVTPSARDSAIVIAAETLGQASSTHLLTYDLKQGMILSDVIVPQLASELDSINWINDNRVLGFYRARKFTRYFELDTHSGHVIRSLENANVRISNERLLTGGE
jgi:hypothetical protein